MSKQSDFIAKMTPYAQRAARSTSRDVGVIVAQWAVESGWGNAWSTRINNYGGIKYVGQKESSGYVVADGLKYAKYSSIDRFVDDFIRIFNMSGYGYPAVRAATTPAAEIKALAGSSYAESTYSGGSIIGQVYNDNGLSRLSGGAGGKLQAQVQQGHCLCQQCGYLCKANNK